MQTVLFHSTVFGPIHSRRLGSSLGVNLMPNDGKICSFDCLYCEAGYNAQGPGTSGLPSRSDVARLLEEKLRQLRDSGTPLDVITFSGNGEPTLHPQFAGVVDDTLRLRDEYFPNVKISVLSNATRLADENVCRALARVDNNILKLDSARAETVRLLDRPVDPHYNVEDVMRRIAAFGKQVTVQTMLTRGSHDGRNVDNTTSAELDALIAAYKRMQPGLIMIYTIDRPTPEGTLQHLGAAEMQAAADRIAAETGIPVQVSV